VLRAQGCDDRSTTRIEAAQVLEPADADRADRHRQSNIVRCRLRAYRRAFATMGGVILILSGLDMLNAYFFRVPTLAG
jgi:hypothetical protein